MTTGGKDARARIFGSIRTGLGVTGTESARQAAVAARLGRTEANLVPARARLAPEALLAQFRQLLDGQSATVVELAGLAELPTAVAAYLRSKNLPLVVRTGDEPDWQGVPWEREPALERTHGIAVGSDTAGLSRAFAGISETGTLVLRSGTANPTTLNFLPETHLVAVRRADIVGSYEEMWDRLRATHGVGQMPRTVNFVSGPSRTADIEQQLVMGAHGPRRLLVMIVGEG